MNFGNEEEKKTGSDVSASETYFLEQEGKDKISALWGMSIGCDFCPEHCSELAVLNKAVFKPKKAQLVKEAERRWHLCCAHDASFCSVPKPTAKWAKEKTLQWLRDNRIQDEASIVFVGAKLRSVAKEQSVSNASRAPLTNEDPRRQYTPMEIMARLIGSPGCLFGEYGDKVKKHEPSERILLAECRRRAANSGTTLKAIVTTWLKENPISRTELDDLMPHVNLLKAELEPNESSLRGTVSREYVSNESTTPLGVQQHQPQRQSDSTGNNKVTVQRSFDSGSSDDVEGWLVVPGSANPNTVQVPSADTTSSWTSSVPGQINIGMIALASSCHARGRNVDDGVTNKVFNEYSQGYGNWSELLQMPIVEEAVGVDTQRKTGQTYTFSPTNQSLSSEQTEAAPRGQKESASNTQNRAEQQSSDSACSSHLGEHHRGWNGYLPPSFGSRAALKDDMVDTSSTEAAAVNMSMGISVQSTMEVTSNSSDTPSTYSSFPGSSMMSVHSTELKHSLGPMAEDCPVVDFSNTAVRHPACNRNTDLHDEDDEMKGGSTADDSSITSSMAVLTDGYAGRTTASHRASAVSRVSHHNAVDNVTDACIVDPYNDKGKYTGPLLSSSGMPHGTGTMLYEDGGRCYDGDWRHGRWHGFGRAVFGNGDIYEGDFRYDQRHGRGKYQFHDGRSYEGEFHEDKRHGKGVFTWPDGASYDGEFDRGKRNGKGRYVFCDDGGGWSIYIGGWVGGNYEGYGECRWADGRVYKGAWKSGMAHGYGIETKADGQVRHDGKWIKDVPQTTESPTTHP